MMRLDKFVAESLAIPRAQAKGRILKGRVKLNDDAETNPAYKISNTDRVSYQGEELSLPGQKYLVLHKPAGYLCSVIDEEYPSALNLIQSSGKQPLHFAGRLDQDTTGLVLITDDGKWSHRVTSPRKICQKTYRVWLEQPIELAACERLTNGVMLHGEEKPTQKADVKIIDEKEILLTISEGRYHQVKRMLAAVGNKVARLHRESVGAVTLHNLQEGDWRELTKDEIDAF